MDRPAPRPIPTLLCALAALAAGCGRENPVTLAVIAPDGGNPFRGPDAATHARIFLEDDATAPVTEPVGPRGEFRVRISPGDPTRFARVRIEALRGDEVVATGATPPVGWAREGGQARAVLMHHRDTLVPAPVGLDAPRADARLVPAGLEIVLAFTSPGDGAPAGPVSGYHLAAHARLEFPWTPVPGEFDGQTAVVSVHRGWVLQRFARGLLYTGTEVVPSSDVPLPPERQALAGASVVDDPAGLGGGWLLGGHRADGAPSDRVDRVTTSSTGTPNAGFAADAATPPRLATPRDSPAVVALERPADGAPGRWLLVGGQGSAADATLLEVYSPASGGALLRTGHADIDARTDVAAVCLRLERGVCERVLLLGGRVGAQLAADDVLLDGGCALRQGVDCTVVLARVPLVSRRRFGARAALAEGGRVVVAGGRDGDGAVGEVESIDASDADAPRTGRVVATLPYADPSVLSLTNGSVMLAGGRDSDGAARSEVWFYRF